MDRKMTNFNTKKDEGIICHILYKLYRIDKPLLRKFILRFLLNSFPKTINYNKKRPSIPL